MALAIAAVAIGALWGDHPVSAQSAEGPSVHSGCLSFHEVHPKITAQEASQAQVPVGYKIYPLAGSKDNERLLVREIPVVRGSDLADAQPSFDARTSEPILAFRFNAVGARKFGAFTANNVGRPFAIVIDERVISAPVIREPILGGAGQVSSNLTIAEVQRIAAKLKSGTCP